MLINEQFYPYMAPIYIVSFVYQYIFIICLCLILYNNIIKMNIIKKTTHNYIYACSMCHVSSNQLDKAKGSQKADKLNHA